MHEKNKLNFWEHNFSSAEGESRELSRSTMASVNHSNDAQRVQRSSCKPQLPSSLKNWRVKGSVRQKEHPQRKRRGSTLTRIRSSCSTTESIGVYKTTTGSQITFNSSEEYNIFSTIHWQKPWQQSTNAPSGAFSRDSGKRLRYLSKPKTKQTAWSRFLSTMTGKSNETGFKSATKTSISCNGPSPCEHAQNWERRAVYVMTLCM